MREPSVAVQEALAVTAEVCGADISEAAARVMMADLAEYPENQILEALTRTRREHKGRLSLAAVLERIPDGHPGAEEAWAMVPKREMDTGVLTREMSKALGVAQPLIDTGDEIAARMAFREAYNRAVALSKTAGRSAEWSVSLGWDPANRVAVVADAVQQGRLTLEAAQRFLGVEHAADLAKSLGAPQQQAITLAPNVRKALETGRLPERESA